MCQESFEERWNRLVKNYSFDGAYAHESGAARDKKNQKVYRKIRKMDLKARVNLDDGECCSNCFILDKDLYKESGFHLASCSRCRQVKYCSRDCQREHWKKAHRKQCVKVEGGTTETTSSSKPSKNA